MRRLGLLAEDETDCETIKVLVERLAPGAGIRVLGRSDGGCAAIRKKAARWMADLHQSGCTAVIVLHDRDRYDEEDLRSTIARHAVPQGLTRYICIPVEEIEAWFWSDPGTLRRIARRPHGAHPTPHSIRSPKEALRRLSKDEGRKPRYSTNENPLLAAKLDLERCAKACHAFADLRDFVRRFAASTAPAPAGRSERMVRRTRPRR